MKNRNLISLTIGLSYAIIILGIIHDTATYTPIIKGGLTCLNTDNLQAMLYMSLICGSSFILSGIVLILLLKKVNEFAFLRSPILVLGIFLGICGILAVVYMGGNPFAYIALILNVSILITSLVIFTRLKKASKSL